MKEVIEGVLTSAYYNECEAGCPIGFIPSDMKGEDFKGPFKFFGLGSPSRGVFGSRSECMVLCDLFKLTLGLNMDDSGNHEYLGKKIKITIEVDDSEFTTNSEDDEA